MAPEGHPTSYKKNHTTDESRSSLTPSGCRSPPTLAPLTRRTCLSNGTSPVPTIQASALRAKLGTLLLIFCIVLYDLHGYRGLQIVTRLPTAPPNPVFSKPTRLKLRLPRRLRAIFSAPT